MNKILIAILVVGAGYVAYDSLNKEEDSTAAKVAKVVDNQENIDVAPIIEEVYDNNSTTLDGRYILNITTDTTETSQVFTFNSNGTFELNREMISPNPDLAGSVEGTYFIKENTVHLVFPTDRDKKTFPVDTAEMTIKSETEIEYTGYIAHKD